MKKVVLFTLMLVVAMGMQAKSLNGKWKTIMEENGQKMEFHFTFNKSILEMTVVIRHADPEVGTFTVSVTSPLTYTLNGDTLKIKPDGGEVTVNIDKIEFVGEIATVVQEHPEVEKLINEQLKKNLEETKGEMAKALPTDGYLTIVSQTDTQLILRDEADKEMIFSKVK